MHLALGMINAALSVCASPVCLDPDCDGDGWPTDESPEDCDDWGTTQTLEGEDAEARAIYVSVAGGSWWDGLISW